MGVQKAEVYEIVVEYVEKIEINSWEGQRYTAESVFAALAITCGNTISAGQAAESVCCLRMH